MTATQLINPATEEVLRSVDHVDAAAVDDAVGRARAAQRRWAALSPAHRAEGLRAFAAAVDAHIDELAALEVANSGHPIASAESEARPRPRRADVLCRQPGTLVRQADSRRRAGSTSPSTNRWAWSV